MNKTRWLILLILGMLLVSVPARAEGESVLISRQTVPNGGEITIHSDQPIILGTGWGACTKGLVRAFIRGAALHWEINGEPIFSYDLEAQKYWGSITVSGTSDLCVVGDGTVWRSDWRYPYGTLEPGDYSIFLEGSVRHRLIDGGDYDGDGKPDRFIGVYTTYAVTVHVIP
jgi:hypothetical protein